MRNSRPNPWVAFTVISTHATACDLYVGIFQKMRFVL